MNYDNYTVEDLAADSFFRQWVLQPDQDSDQFWVNVLQQHPQQAATVVRAIQLVRQLNQATTPEQSAADPDQLDAIWQALQKKVDQEAYPPSPVGRVVRVHSLWGRWAAAAGIVLALGIGWWFANRPGSVRPTGTGSALIATKGESLREQTNNTTEVILIKLTDGSTVELQPNSRISYPESFASDRREVSLSGDAFFQVTKNPGRPFLVYAGETVTKVVGTSFRVRAFEQDKTVSVVVRTGRVSVFSRRDFDRQQQQAAAQVAGVLLTPNQRATFHRWNEQLAKDLIEEPLPLPSTPLNQELVFDDRPVADVFKALESQYGLDIIFDATTLSHCLITTTLSSNEGLYKRLDRICRAIGATYETVDGQLIITSTGCTP
ncbi:FecR family protein [Fibrisoma montanum]|uniref:FecR family protein n=1 Tax=Fibrisoma montanum TaxID=2305895 RepID=A0A418LZ82_9BACT|nr:FecR family protein [Fibrisoma montanum]RIV18658.1 FecR family protein [Fibrisoma montanum]